MKKSTMKIILFIAILVTLYVVWLIFFHNRNWNQIKIRTEKYHHMTPKSTPVTFSEAIKILQSPEVSVTTPLLVYAAKDAAAMTGIMAKNFPRIQYTPTDWDFIELPRDFLGHKEGNFLVEKNMTPHSQAYLISPDGVNKLRSAMGNTKQALPDPLLPGLLSTPVLHSLGVSHVKSLLLV